MSKGKRIGYGVLSLLPLLFMLLIQVLGGQIIYAAVTVYMSMQPGMDPAMLNDIVYTYVMEHYTGVLVLIQGVTLLVFGFLALHGKKKRALLKICFIYITWPVFFCCLSVFISSLPSFWSRPLIWCLISWTNTIC